MHGTPDGAEMTHATGARPARAQWTPEEDATLRELWATGLTCTEIGVRLGKTRSSITGRAHRSGLPPRPSPLTVRPTGPSHRQQVLQLYQSGVTSIREIQKRLKFKYSRIAELLRTSGIEIPVEAPVPRKISARLTQWRAAGESTPPIPVAQETPDPATLVKGIGGRRAQCQFIPYDSDGEHTLYCGKPVFENRPYCTHHVLVCYRPHPLQNKVSHEET